MKKTLAITGGLILSFVLGFYVNSKMPKETIKNDQSPHYTKKEKTKTMKLGAFSISLNVKDLEVSKQFYEQLGFTVLGGDLKQNYLIMKNENSLIGLFQGMFEQNILTFNPGWDSDAKNIEEFDDVRSIQQHLKSKDIKIVVEADEKTSGPASMVLTDPDGNVIYIDQHR